MVTSRRLRILQNQLAQCFELLVVEPRRRFIEQQQLRPGRKRPRELDALLKAERQIRNHSPADGFQAQKRGQFRGTVLQSPLFPSNQRQRDGIGEKSAARAAVAADHDVFEHRQGSKQRKILERPADAERGDPVHRIPCQRLPLEPDRALVEVVKARQTIEQRGLAGAVRADQPADCAPRHVEADPIERDNAAEPNGDALDRQQRIAGGRRLETILSGAGICCGYCGADRRRRHRRPVPTRSATPPIRPTSNNSHLTIANLQSFSTENDSASHAVAARIFGVAAATKAAKKRFPCGGVDSFAI